MKALRAMRISRKVAIIGLALSTLFFSGAALGSYVPNGLDYLIIIYATIVANVCIVFGYTGREKKNANSDESSKPSRQ